MDTQTISLLEVSALPSRRAPPSLPNFYTYLALDAELQGCWPYCRLQSASETCLSRNRSEEQKNRARTPLPRPPLSMRLLSCYLCRALVSRELYMRIVTGEQPSRRSSVRTRREGTKKTAEVRHVHYKSGKQPCTSQVNVDPQPVFQKSRQ